MDDRRHLEAILKSPSSFLLGLGLDRLYLYRPRGWYSDTIELSDLDDNIRNRGPAYLLRGFTRSGNGVAIRFTTRSAGKDTYSCRYLRFDYIRGNFSFGLYKNASAKVIFYSMEEMWRAGYILKPTYRSIFLPTA